MENNIPGTTIPYEGGGSMFAMFRPLIKATDGLTLSQVCAITGLEGSTIQNWVKRGFVSRPVNKKYRERQLARILLISSLRDSMKIDRIGELMSTVNGDANDTGDDIISEEQMYDYFCEVIGSASGEVIKPAEFPRIVAQTTSDYEPPSEDAAKRLNDALTVMVFAYASARLKQQADSLFLQIKES